MSDDYERAYKAAKENAILNGIHGNMHNLPTYILETRDPMYGGADSYGIYTQECAETEAQRLTNLGFICRISRVIG
jgi:hypothetical protein